MLNVSAAAQRLWTSTQKLEDVPPEHHAELCSMINRALRDDAPAIMPSLAVLVRGINVLCITRRKPGEQKLPTSMRTFRGGELPMAFYRQRVGQKYRCVWRGSYGGVRVVTTAENTSSDRREGRERGSHF